MPPIPTSPQFFVDFVLIEVFRNISREADNANPSRDSKWRIYCTPSAFAHVSKGSVLPQQEGEDMMQILSPG